MGPGPFLKKMSTTPISILFLFVPLSLSLSLSLFGGEEEGVRLIVYVLATYNTTHPTHTNNHEREGGGRLGIREAQTRPISFEKILIEGEKEAN